jgi:zinc transport system permease protein
VIPQFISFAALASLGLACLAGPLGCIVVWRRLSYFGETLAHAALPGFALGLALSFSPLVGVALTCTAVALLLSVLRQRSALASDTVLGILAHGSLAVGIISISLAPRGRISLENLLFGDLLSVGRDELYLTGLAVIVGFALVASQWRALVSWSVHEELAAVEGVPVRQVELLFMLAMAITIAIGMKTVGAVLVTALLIIPAATARRLSRSPEMMAVWATALAAIALGAGLLLSLWWDIPAGPAAILAALVLFLTSLVLPPRL